MRYESLVDDTEQTLREVLDFLGEPWHNDVLRYYLKARSATPDVTCASDQQVREPIYATSVGRWRHDMPAHERKGISDRGGRIARTVRLCRRRVVARAPAPLAADERVTAHVPGSPVGAL